MPSETSKKYELHQGFLSLELPSEAADDATSRNTKTGLFTKHISIRSMLSPHQGPQSEMLLLFPFLQIKKLRVRGD